MTLADVRIEHPLAMTTAEEVEHVRATLAEAGLLGETVRFAFLLPEEPPKTEVLAFTEGDAVDRRFRVALLDLATGRSWDTIVSATHGEVVSSRELDPATDGQPPIIDSEFMVVEDILNADPGWLAALEKRGITTSRRCGRRRCRRASTTTPRSGDAGSCARSGSCRSTRRTTAGRTRSTALSPTSTSSHASVDRIIDAEALPLPPTSGNFDDPRGIGPPPDTLARSRSPSRTGPSFTIDGNRGDVGGLVPSRIGFDAREGIVLHQVALRRRRPVLIVPGVGGRDGCALRRPVAGAVLAELLRQRRVPARPGRQLSRAGLRLPRRHRLLRRRHRRRPRRARDHPATPSACTRRTSASLWKHTDFFTGSARPVATPPGVVLLHHRSATTTTASTGTSTSTARSSSRSRRPASCSPRPPPGSPIRLAGRAGLGAPYHQHLFCARLDMTVDGCQRGRGGRRRRVPIGPDNPYGNAFTRHRTRLARESRRAGRPTPRRHAPGVIINPEAPNRLGQPVGYALLPAEQAPRCWPTRRRRSPRGPRSPPTTCGSPAYDPAERYPAGDFVNQHPGGAGLPA